MPLLQSLRHFVLLGLFICRVQYWLQNALMHKTDTIQQPLKCFPWTARTVFGWLFLFYHLYECFSFHYCKGIISTNHAKKGRTNRQQTTCNHFHRPSGFIFYTIKSPIILIFKNVSSTFADKFVSRILTIFRCVRRKQLFLSFVSNSGSKVLFLSPFDHSKYNMQRTILQRLFVHA